MKTEKIITMLGIAGVAFVLWEWNSQQQRKRIRSDSHNLSNDWTAVGNDIRYAMKQYEQKIR